MTTQTDTPERSTGPAPGGPHAMTFIVITLLIDVTGLGIILPVLPELIMELTGEPLADAAIYGGFMLFLYAATQFVFAPIIGNLSDRFGRRPVLLGSLTGLGIDYLIMAFASTLGWLFLGRFLSGIMGASHTTAAAYIADVSPPEKRAQNFGLLGAAFGIGFIIGPVVGGLLGEFGPRVPFFAAAALAFVNVTYGYFVLPETLAVGKRRPFEWRRANPVGALMQVRRYPVVIGLLIAYLLYHLAHQVYPSAWTYYTIAKFDWSSGDIGLSLGFVGVMSAIVQGGLIRWIIPQIGPWRAALIGLALSAVAFGGYALVTQGWMIYPVIVVGAFAGICAPAIQGLVSNQVPANEQGELQGAMTSLVSLSAIMSPPVMTQMFATFTGPDAPAQVPGAPFLLAALLAVLALVPILTNPRSPPAPVSRQTP